MAKIEAKRAKLPLLKHVVMMRGATAATGDDVLTWDEFLAKADGVAEAELDERIDALEQADLATLIYTSGTTGPPKGVMLSHQNLAWTSRALLDIGGARDGDVLAVVPAALAHRRADVHDPHAGHTRQRACTSPSRSRRCPRTSRRCGRRCSSACRASGRSSTPAIAAKLAEATGAKKQLVAWARRVVARVNAHARSRRAAAAALELQYRLADRARVLEAQARARPRPRARR